MIVKCMKCEKVKELTGEEMREVGEFVVRKKLRAVHFLKFLSMDLREDNLCTNGKNHEYEFDPRFDKEIHELAKVIKDTKDVMTSSEEEEAECIRIIEETITRKDVATARIIENGEKKQKLLENMKTIAWIPDETLWT